MWRLGVLAMAACGGSTIVEPQGEVRTYIVDDYAVPHTVMEAREMGCDINGDRSIDNQLGQSISTQAQENNVTPYVADLIGSRALDSVVQLQSDTLVDEPVVGARYLGYPGAPSAELLGAFNNAGIFTTKRAGEAIARMPVFVDADVSQVQLNAFHLELVPDGAGGYDGKVCGAVLEMEAQEDAGRAMIQMVNNNPADHPYAIALLDANKDGAITMEEFLDNSLILALLSYDVTIDDRRMISTGFRVHLTRCDGECPAPAPSVNRCFDRARGEDESDIDCGGADCRGCAAGLACRGPADCASNACDAGLCRAPTCSDGVLDGFESDVDCGWHCTQCTLGKTCERAADCASNYCNSSKVCGVSP